MSWIRRHIVVISVGIFGLLSFAGFSWAEYGYFCDQAKDHHSSCASFWSAEHMHDWIYNTMSNWQSEALIGIVLLVAVLSVKRGSEEQAEEDV